MVERARRLLPTAGYDQVRTCVADGANGAAPHAPFDRILVTVEAADLAPAWVEQLTAAGRMVVPLRLRGLTRSVAFDRDAGHLRAHGYELCGFVPMRGVAACQEQLVVLHDGDDAHVGLRLDDWQVENTAPLRQAFSEPRVETWSQVTMGRGLPYDDLDLWLATALDDYALLAATPTARERGLVTSASPIGISALVDSDRTSFAYLTMRPTSPERTVFEFGAAAHGPHAQHTAERLVEQIHRWDHQARGERAQMRAYPSHTPDADLPVGRVVDRAAFRFMISWPSAGR